MPTDQKDVFATRVAVPRIDRSSLWRTGAQVLAKHWPDYLKEAAGLMIFMLGAGVFTTLFEYPGSSVRQAIPSDLLRHIGLGIVMACVTAAIIYSPWGQKSGAHINPAVTWSFYRLGKITGADAAFYTAFQFAGGILAPIVLLWAIGTPFGDPEVRYATTQPGPDGIVVALVAEFVISFVLMLVLLIATNSARFEKATGAIAAVLIGVYIAFESPLSGMSLNPARTFGSALTSGEWHGTWLYFVGPVLAMLLAAEIYRWMCSIGLIAGKNRSGSHRTHCIICDYKAGPDYPIEHAKA